MNFGTIMGLIGVVVSVIGATLNFVDANTSAGWAFITAACWALTSAINANALSK